MKHFEFEKFHKAGRSVLIVEICVDVLRWALPLCVVFGEANRVKGLMPEYDLSVFILCLWVRLKVRTTVSDEVDHANGES